MPIVPFGCRLSIVCHGRKCVSRVNFHANKYHAFPSKRFDTDKKRNIGVIAHVDAGKTTVTERLLYLTGASKTIGDVDSGNTITDFMDLERERGITIQSASVSSVWKDHQINFIDTPGHVDFTLEVERSLRVMDGAITCIDASAGVQAQTLTVWCQATKFKLPSVFFVNKMDKAGANFDDSVRSIESRLSHQVVPIVIPVVLNGKVIGLIDLLNQTHLDLRKPESDWAPFNESFAHYDLYNANWENLVSNLSDVNEEFESEVISSQEPISKSIVRTALRKSTLNLSLSPVACGSGLKSVASVRPILDMIVDFLPSPLDRHFDSMPNSVDTCALVYKIGHDKRRGQLSYARIFKGQLKENTSILNANRDMKEINFKLFLPFGDLLHPVDMVSEGDIAVISGFRHTVTGDTLVNSAAIKSHIGAETHKYVLEGISSPDPVFSCSIEAPSSASTSKFEEALNELCVEDPSLRIRQDFETGQTIMDGMGELHIEVIKERLRREYGLNVFMGPLRVGYREFLDDMIEHTTFTEDLFGEEKQKHWCSIKLKLQPTEKMTSFKGVTVSLDTSDDESQHTIRPNWLKAINEGCKLALFNGPVLGFPICNLAVTLRSLSTSGNRVNLALLNAGASRCVKEALKLAGVSLIEPIMTVEITLVCDQRGDLFSETVLHELSQRRAAIVKIDQDNYGRFLVIHASLPLSETQGIANKIRSISSGMCSIHLALSEYQHVSTEEQSKILERRQHEGI